MLQNALPIVAEPPVARELSDRFGSRPITVQSTRDGIPTIWVDRAELRESLQYLKSEAPDPYVLLFDLRRRATMSESGKVVSEFGE